MKQVVLVFAMILAMARSQTALEAFSDGIEKLTSKLYKEIIKVKPNQSVIFSPFSLIIILALAREGSKGQTENELTSALDLPSKSKTEEAVRQLYSTFQTNTEDIKLLSANKMYLASNFKILDSFKEVATDPFKAGIENVDFNEAQQAANIINQWVEQQTNNKIKNLIKPDNLSALTRLVLVNTLYFIGKWKRPFKEYLTKKETFYTSNASCKKVDMMHINETFKFYDSQKCDAKLLILSYLGMQNISMTIVLPNKKEGLATLETKLGLVLSENVIEYQRVAVSLPKFLVETEVELKPILQNIGVTTIFSSSADLSGISEEFLEVSDVTQKCFISVNENGTEAAAATAGGIITTSIPPDPTIFFNANHPFIYFIKLNDVILFVGKVIS